MPRMVSYREQVRDAIARRTGEALLNGSVDHAAVIVQETFGNAKNCMRILSSKLDAECYGRESVRNAARVFLADPEHRARFLVESPLWDEGENFEWEWHPFISDIRSFANLKTTKGDMRFEFRAVPKDWTNQYQFNFLVMDDYGYRFEPNRKEAAAVVAFLPEDDKKAATNLIHLFDTLWAHAKPIQLRHLARV